MILVIVVMTMVIMVIMMTIVSASQRGRLGHQPPAHGYIRSTKLQHNHHSGDRYRYDPH
jgi:hypothetical protein